MRLGGFDEGVRKGPSGGRRGWVCFHRNVGCEDWGIDLVRIIEGMGDSTFGCRRRKCKVR